ncbi:MAG: hypothetical protein ACQKBU_12645, partial [Verrucomicrobiales bacterium]
MITLNDFDLTGGFKLEVEYTISSTGNALADRVNFGVIDSANIPQEQATSTYLTDFISNNRGQYGIGMDLTTNDDNQGLGVAQDTTITSLSNEQEITVGSHSVVIYVDAQSNWYYGIDGAPLSSGAIPGGFDFTRSYSFAAFVQGIFSEFTIDSVTLTTLDGDVTAPTPDPLTWEVEPTGLSPSTMTMTATTATDESGVQYYFTNESVPDGSHDSGWQSSPTYVDSELDSGTSYSYSVKVRDLSPNQNEGVASVSAFGTTLSVDLDAPTPDPMGWDSFPEATGPTEITMTATTATDVSGVEYYFTNETVTDGSHDSGWQESPTYVDTGLEPGTSYTYHVKARDLSPQQNETEISFGLSATTDSVDGTPPSPDPMSFADTPTAISESEITMTATTATDDDGVEYYFANVTDSAHVSGWQDSPTYTDAGILPVTTYSYTVTARDKSLLQNETFSSSPASATTAEATDTELLFADSFERSDSATSDGTGLTESFSGMTGMLGGLTWDSVVFPEGSVLDINSGAMRFDSADADGSSGGVAYISDHNFVDAQILAAGGFTVSVEIESALSSGNSRNPGFGIGQSLAEIEALTGANASDSLADVFVGYDNFSSPQGIAVYHNGELQSQTEFTASQPDVLTAAFEFTDFSAGSDLSYKIYLDGILIASGST